MPKRLTYSNAHSLLSSWKSVTVYIVRSDLANTGDKYIFFIRRGVYCLHSSQCLQDREASVNDAVCSLVYAINLAHEHIQSRDPLTFNHLKKVRDKLLTEAKVVLGEL